MDRHAILSLYIAPGIFGQFWSVSQHVDALRRWLTPTHPHRCSKMFSFAILLGNLTGACSEMFNSVQKCSILAPPPNAPVPRHVKSPATRAAGSVHRYCFIFI